MPGNITQDPLLLKDNMEIGVNPCGWCGRERCKVQLVTISATPGNSNTINSSCPYHYFKMIYSKAAQYSRSSPCPNVPIHCPTCPPSLSGQPKTSWKYNTFAHFAAQWVVIACLKYLPNSLLKPS
ncbi:hypothetical protein L208DRAFT_1261897 [Tricholoma matsutake]|nr:hypothetical protein L208DRAFT_1261897 [Tricholoma matsutake 945]